MFSPSEFSPKREIAISEKSIMYRAMMPKIAKARSELSVIPLVEPRHSFAISLKVVLQRRIYRVSKYNWHEIQTVTITHICTVMPTVMPATAYANGIDTIPPPMMVDIMASVVPQTPLPSS